MSTFGRLRAHVGAYGLPVGDLQSVGRGWRGVSGVLQLPTGCVWSCLQAACGRPTGRAGGVQPACARVPGAFLLFCLV